MQIPNATLLLKTADLPAFGTSNDVGQLINANGWIVQFNNLSLSEIIGQDEFEKYDFFEIQLISTIQSINPGTVIAGSVALTYLTAFGLPFICNYVYCNSSFQVASQPQVRSEVPFSEMVNLAQPTSPYSYFVSYGVQSATIGTQYSSFEPSPLIFSKVDTFDLKLTARVFDGNQIPTTTKTSKDAYLMKIRGINVTDIRSQFCLRGILNSSAGVYTYNNFNMRLALGLLWDKYELFSIKMSRMFHTFDGGAAGITNTDRPCYLTLKGLDFVSSKNYVNNTTTQEQVLCHLQYNNAGNSYAGYKHNTNEAIIFKKGQELVSLEIKWNNIMGTAWAYDFTRPHMFYFVITPVIV